MPSKRDTWVHDPQTHQHVFDQYHQVIPQNPLEALLMAAPGDEPVESSDEKQERYGPLRDALESGVLTDREVWVVEAIFWRRLGLRTVAAELGMSKTQVARIRDSALVKLKEVLS